MKSIFFIFSLFSCSVLFLQSSFAHIPLRSGLEYQSAFEDPSDRSRSFSRFLDGSTNPTGQDIFFIDGNNLVARKVKAFKAELVTTKFYRTIEEYIAKCERDLKEAEEKNLQTQGFCKMLLKMAHSNPRIINSAPYSSRVENIEWSDLPGVFQDHPFMVKNILSAGSAAPAGPEPQGAPITIFVVEIAHTKGLDEEGRPFAAKLKITIHLD